MNINSNAKRILCFGDSNTYGVMPGSIGRYPANVRWTGVLQRLLGDDYEIIEEGLPGRTTNIDDPFPGYEDKNGAEYLFPCIGSHRPFDMIILMLGTNDFKKVYGRSASDVAGAIKGLIKIIKKYANTDDKKVRIILMSPAHILHFVKDVKPHFAGSPEKSVQLADEIEKVAHEEGCEFLDISKFAKTGEVDGLHLTEESHKNIGEKLAKIIVNNK